MNAPSTPSTEPRFPSAGEIAAMHRQTQIRGAAIASGNGPMPSAAVKVPSAALMRILHTIIDGNEHALLGAIHPNYADVQMTLACLRAQTPEVIDLRWWDEPTSIYKSFADDGLTALTYSEEFFADDYAYRDENPLTESSEVRS